MRIVRVFSRREADEFAYAILCEFLEEHLQISTFCFRCRKKSYVILILTRECSPWRIHIRFFLARASYYYLFGFCIRIRIRIRIRIGLDWITGTFACS